MTDWRPDKETLKRPAYRSLVEQVSEAVRLGRIEPGEQLPPQRELAGDLGLSLQTVSRAYEELRRRGLARGEIGRGTFIQAAQPVEATPFREYRMPGSVVDLSIYKPVTGPLHKERMGEALARLGEDIPDDVLFAFRPNQGLPHHLEAGREWLKGCGLMADKDRIIITNGVTQGTLAALLTTCKPGGTLLAGAVGHHSLASLCSYLGIKLKGVEIDEQGIVPDALDRACREGGVQAIYLIPNLAGPMVSLMTEERRKAVVEIARAHDVFILENDVLAPLNPKAPPLMTAMAPERCFYLTSFTKCIMPGLRSGYLVVPPGMMAAARNRLLATAWMATPLMAELAARWVMDGTARDLMLWQRKAIHERFLVASKILYKFDYLSHPYALHIWLPLTGRWRTAAFVAQAQKLGVAVAPSTPFVVNLNTDMRAVRVSLGSASEADLKRGLRVLAQLLEGEPAISLGQY